MSASQDRETNKHQSKKLRTACDICHHAKMKCSGGTPCQGCRGSDHDCIYSVSKRIGRPKGTKNKRTTDRMSRQQLEKERKSHKDERQSQLPVSTPSASHITGRRSEPLASDGNTGRQWATMSNTSIDMLLENESNTPYPLPSSEGHGLFADTLHRWYDFGVPAETSPLKQQSSLTSSFQPIGSFPNNNTLQHSHNHSPYISPGSVFGEMGSVAFVSAAPTNANPTPSASSSSLHPSSEYYCLPTARDFPDASATSSRGALNRSSISSFSPQSRLSYPR